MYMDFKEMGTHLKLVFTQIKFLKGQSFTLIWKYGMGNECSKDKLWRGYVYLQDRPALKDVMVIYMLKNREVVYLERLRHTEQDVTGPVKCMQ